MSAVGSTPEEPLRIVVVNAGLSSESATARLGHALMRSLRDHATRRALSVEVTVVDLRPLARAVADALTTGFAPPDLQTALDAVGAAHGVIALTPVYRASFSGLFKSFFDVVDEDSLRGTPVLLGATGGTPRHALVTETALRPLFTYLHAPTVTTAVYAATEDWGASAADSDGSGGTRLGTRVHRATSELLDMVAPAPTTGPRVVPRPGSGDTPATADPGTSSEAGTYPGFVDFETLLHGGGER